MIDSIITGIATVLHQQFGYDVYKNKISQNLDPPCFYIKCIEPSSRKMIDKRYERRHLFDIHYFPSKDSEDEKGECYQVGEKLFECLEVIHCDGFSIRGTSMNFDVKDDGVLHFFVNYNGFVHKVEQKGDPMEIMHETVNVEE